MARDWNDTKSVQGDIFARMALYGMNIASIPFTVYLERRGDTEVWVVDLHVKVRRTIEFELTGEGPTLPEAMRRAYLALNNEPMVRANAAQGNATFGIAI